MIFASPPPPPSWHNRLLVFVAGVHILTSNNPPNKLRKVSQRHTQEALRDLSRTQKERDLARELLKTAMAFANVAIWELDIENDALLWEGDYAGVWGDDALTALTTGQLAYARITDEDREMVQLKFHESIKQDYPFREDFRINHPDGTVHWLAGRGNHKIVDGRIILTGVNFDITELKNREHMANLLTRELHHRMRNLFATIRAILSLSKNSAKSVNDYVERVDARLSALNRAQTVLLNSNFLTGSMHALMQEISAAFPRIRWHGPDVKLPENELVAFALVFNELATNTSKHGALSVRTGFVMIDWSIAGEPDIRSNMVIEWREFGGPTILKMPHNLGFGSQLIQRSVQDNLKGLMTANWSPSGLHYSISIPGNWQRL